jgi:RNA polymerase sigma-70 factor (ECF subfamily)
MSHPLPAIEPDEVRRTLDRSGAARWGVGASQWEAALGRSLAARFGDAPPTGAALSDYLQTLHLEDLALATACIEGAPLAWDHFVLTLRPVLYRSADAVRGAGDAREVADSLYAELYGLQERDGARRSLLRYYHGRASLATWLRSVLAQRMVDRVRAARRLVSLEEPGIASEALDCGGGHGLTAGTSRPGAPGDPDRARHLSALRQALAASIAALDAGLRLRLALYYAQGMKLAAIGRLVGESEATVSRRLDKARREIRAAVARRLRDEHGLNAAQIEEAFAEAPSDERFDLREVLPAPDS